MSPFDFRDYKEYLRARMQGTRGQIAPLAAAAGCHRSYFSQVLHSHVHLTPEQALGVAEFFALPRADTDFFCLLVDLARAGTPRLRNKIETRMLELARERENLGKRFQTKSVEPGERELLYYSHWHYAAVHVSTSIPELQSAEAIAGRLGLPLLRVREVLEALEKHGFVQRKGRKWVLGTGDVHVPKRSLLNSVNHANWRTQAVQRSQTDSAEGLHYTSVASLSRKDFAALKTKLLAVIDDNRRVIAASPEEELVCFTCDFFAV
jgi:uncharacterized protein (TIGR02147 family)